MTKSLSNDILFRGIGAACLGLLLLFIFGNLNGTKDKVPYLIIGVLLVELALVLFYWYGKNEQKDERIMKIEKDGIYYAYLSIFVVIPILWLLDVFSIIHFDLFALQFVLLITSQLVYFVYFVPKKEGWSK